MKAILVIDMPVNGCESCMFDTYGICLVRANEKDINKRANKNWCPLKPLPQKKQHGEEIDYEYGYIDGWNDCLEEME